MQTKHLRSKYKRIWEYMVKEKMVLTCFNILDFV